MINERIKTKRMAVQTSRVGSLAVDAIFCILSLGCHPEVYKALMDNPQQILNVTGFSNSVPNIPTDHDWSRILSN